LDRNDERPGRGEADAGLRVADRPAVSTPSPPSDYRAAKENLAHRFRSTAVIDVEGEDRVAFLQGQLTQDVKTLRPGEARPAAGLTPKGKLIFVARVVSLPDRLRLLLTPASRVRTVEHLKKYAVFQKVAINDQSDDFLRIGFYGPAASDLATADARFLLLPGEHEFSREVLSPADARGDLDSWLATLGSTAVSDETAEVLRIEAGRPRFGQDAEESHLADEVGLEEAISTTKGCYVGQEIVARMRTYGRVNRRLVGFRFPQGAIPAGTILRRAGQEGEDKIEWGRVTSSAVSPVFGAIGMGYAFRDLAFGDRLVSTADLTRPAVVSELPFA
jgi:folate-binding protein YgfZ